jgi:hypothetical protein
MPLRLLSLAVVVLLLGFPGPARTVDVRVAGGKLVLREKRASEHLVLVAREDVVAPLPGSSVDPTLVGGELEISNPDTGERARFTTSARDWAVSAVGTVFSFRNRLETGPGAEVRAIVIKKRRRLKLSTRALGITLDEEAQRALSVVLRTGTRRYCVLFGGRIGKDRPGRFVARRAPAPVACPGPITVASTTTTSRPPGTGPTTSSVTSRSRPPTPTTSSTTVIVLPTTSTSTSTSSSTTAPPVPTTSSTQPPPPTTSTTSVPTTSTTSTTKEPSCGFRGNSCKGTCPSGRRCESLFGRLCVCVLP